MSRRGLSRKQRKGLEATKRLLGPGADVRAYAAGRGAARMTTAAWIIIGGFCAAFVAMLAVYGVVLVPGFLAILVLYVSITRFHALAVTESGLVLLGVSRWTGLPSRPVALLPYAILWPPYAEPTRGRVRVHLQHDYVTVRQHEYDQLVGAALQATTAPVAVQQPGITPTVPTAPMPWSVAIPPLPYPPPPPGPPPL